MSTNRVGAGINYGEDTLKVRIVNKYSYITIICSFAGCIVVVILYALTIKMLKYVFWTEISIDVV